jgi:mevalonate pyrophosphate decarboxylase
MLLWKYAALTTRIRRRTLASKRRDPRTACRAASGGCCRAIFGSIGAFDIRRKSD